MIPSHVFGKHVAALRVEEEVACEQSSDLRTSVFSHNGDAAVGRSADLDLGSVTHDASRLS